MNGRLRTQIHASDQEMIERYIREHGVTRCPAAFAVETRATLVPEDAAVHAARCLAPGDSYRLKRGRAGWNNWNKRRKPG